MALDEQSSARGEVIALIAALGRGDAERGDVLTSLRDVGVDSLEGLVDALADASRRGPRGRVPQWADPQRPARETPPEVRARIVHPVPKLPFVLRGTLYDPADISRFDGQELHFVVGPSGDVITAIDDTGMMTGLWQMSFLMAPNMFVTSRGSGVVDTGVSPTDIGVNPGGGAGPPGTEPPGARVDLTPWGGQSSSGGQSTDGPPTPPPPPWPRWVTHPPPPPPPPPPPSPVLYPLAEFHEHMNFQGDNFTFRAGEAQNDLTELGMTWFWDGDWNDKISSVRLWDGAWAIMWEHVRYGGCSVTVTQSTGYLDALGWNDRASCIEAH